MTLPNPDSIEVLADGVAVQWHYDGRLAVFTAQKMTRGAIDTWVDRALEVTRRWDIEQRFLVMHDGSNFGLTPYMRHRVPELARVKPGLTASVAIIVPDNLLGGALSAYAKFIKRRMIDRHTTLKIFTEPAEGFAWLEGFLS